MLGLTIVLSVAGLAFGMTTRQPPETGGINLNQESEWDCSQDHALHQTDPRKFLQSPNGFGEGAAVTEATCPSKLQEFSIEGGKCRCRYVTQLRDLLADECQVRVPPNSASDVYELLVPSLNVDTVDELFVVQTCYSLLPEYRASAYQAAGIIPMFFNKTGCRCDWIEGVDQLIGLDLIAPADLECERIVDQNFSNPRVSSDEVGNSIGVIPYDFQNNMTLRRGGSAFGAGMISNVIYRLQGFDFVDLDLVARFDSELSSGAQVIFTNLCNVAGDGGGIAELTYNPSGRQYSLQFFNGRVATCTASAGAGTQTIQVIYRSGDVRLLVNTRECDVSSLNPIAESDERLQFNSGCPMMIGGAVKTDITQADFNEEDTRVQGLNGVFYRFMALRSCDNPPRMVQDRIEGIVS